ncbi:MAG: sulfatase family protein [Nocardioides sp.]
MPSLPLLRRARTPRARVAKGLVAGLVAAALAGAAAFTVTDAPHTRSSAPVHVEQTYERPTHLAYTPPATPDRRPNVVLITTDDQALSDLRWMPRTRHWLGRAGVTFDSMLSPHPLCCPARAEMMTGEFAQNNGVHTNAGPYGGLPALRQPDNTLPWWLQRTGYLTGMVGKYLNGYTRETGVPRGWDFWDPSDTDRFGYYGYELYGDGRPRWFGHLHYSSDVIRDTTVRLVDRYSAANRPFFIWSSYFAPHGVCGDTGGCANPPVPAYRDAHLYPGVRSPSLDKPSFDEKDVSDKPWAIRHLAPLPVPKAQHEFKQRIRSLAAVDQGVAATMRALQRDHELAHTLVLFTSDNGYLVGEHRYLGKVLPYEEALRVPLLVRGPGVPHDQTRTQPATTVDLAPTILDVTGTTPGRLQDGQSLWPEITSADAPRRDDTVLIQAGGDPGAQHPRPWMYRGVWTARYTFAHWTSEHGFLELYDRQVDPFELQNRAHDPAYAAVVAELLRRTRLLAGCAGASCRQDFGPLPEPSPAG